MKTFSNLLTLPMVFITSLAFAGGKSDFEQCIDVRSGNFEITFAKHEEAEAIQLVDELVAASEGLIAKLDTYGGQGSKSDLNSGSKISIRTNTQSGIKEPLLITPPSFGPKPPTFPGASKGIPIDYVKKDVNVGQGLFGGGQGLFGGGQDLFGGGQDLFGGGQDLFGGGQDLFGGDDLSPDFLHPYKKKYKPTKHYDQRDKVVQLLLDFQGTAGVSIECLIDTKVPMTYYPKLPFTSSEEGDSN